MLIGFIFLQCLHEQFCITKSEAAQLLSSLQRCWVCETDINSTKAKPNPVRMTASSFLGCFEPSTAGSKYRRGSVSQFDSQSGSSSSCVTQVVSLKKGVSSEMTLQLAAFIFKVRFVFESWQDFIRPLFCLIIIKAQIIKSY